MTAEVIILESRCYCLWCTDSCFPVAVGYFLPVVEFSVEEDCLRYANNRLPVVVGYFLLVVEFSIEKLVSCVLGVNNQLTLFMS